MINMRKLFSVILFTVLFFLFISCGNKMSDDDYVNYVVSNYKVNVDKIKKAAPYTTDSVDFEITENIDPERAAEIRKYFKENAELDLDALAASEKTTWEKSMELALFVANNIPHDNQKTPLEKRNAITLWEYSRRVPTGFNCRWHSILLSELLLSIDIKNRFITCIPEDSTDSDCHVVNIVWLPESEKWAMIDSDMTEYVTDSEGTPLSLEEMRNCVLEDKAFKVNVFKGFENSWVNTDWGLEYMQAYWVKNLYWFAAYTLYSFDLEYNEELRSTYLCLVPPGYDCSLTYENDKVTTNAQAFWCAVLY